MIVVGNLCSMQPNVFTAGCAALSCVFYPLTPQRLIGRPPFPRGSDFKSKAKVVTPLGDRIGHSSAFNHLLCNLNEVWHCTAHTCERCKARKRERRLCSDPALRVAVLNPRFLCAVQRPHWCAHCARFDTTQAQGKHTAEARWWRHPAPQLCWCCWPWRHG